MLADQLGEPEQDLLAGHRRLVAPAPVVERPRGPRRPPDRRPRRRPRRPAAIARAVAPGDVVEGPARGGRARTRPSMNSSVRGVDRRGAREPVGGRRLGGSAGRLARHAAYRRMAASSSTIPSPGADGTRRTPSGPGRTGSASMKSRRSGVQPGGSYGNSMNGPPPTPAATCRLASSPMPVGPGVRREPAVPRERELGDRPRPEHPGGQDDVGLVDVERVGLERGDAARRTSGSSRRRRSGCPAPTPRSAASPRRSVPASGSSTHRTSSVGEADGDLAGGDRVERAGRVAGHPPALVEVDHDRHRVADGVARRRDGGEPVLELARIDPDLERAEPLVAEAERRFGARRRRAAASRTRRRPGSRRWRRRTASRPAARRPGRRCPTGRPRAASSGRRGSRSSRAPGRAGRWPADPGRRTGARRPRSRPSCRPSRSRRRPRRSRPGRSSPRTSAAGPGPRPPGTAGSSGTDEPVESDAGDAHVWSITQPQRDGSLTVERAASTVPRHPVARLEELVSGRRDAFAIDAFKGARRRQVVSPGGTRTMDYSQLDKVRRETTPLQLDTVEAFASGRIGRREFIKRATVVGLSMASISMVIAACSSAPPRARPRRPRRVLPRPRPPARPRRAHRPRRRLGAGSRVARSGSPASGPRAPSIRSRWWTCRATGSPPSRSSSCAP